MKNADDCLTRIRIVVPERQSRVIEFARQELVKYLGQPPARLPVAKSSAAGQTIIRLNLDGNDCSSGADEFAIESVADGFILSAGNERALLFCAYAFLEDYCGIRWFHPGEPALKSSGRTVAAADGKKIYRPAYRLRGLYMENSESQLELIDWMAKNRMNHVFMSFRSWETAKDLAGPEIEKRGLILNVGGHSYLKFLPPAEYFTDHPDWYALVENKRIKTGQICFSSDSGKRQLFKNMRAWLADQPKINRLSLWPADNRHYCQCPGCRDHSFLELYGALLGELKSYLREHGLAMEVEHLAYDAGLCFEMMAPPRNRKAVANTDTALAYWGRDYGHPFETSPADMDKQARRIEGEWAAHCRETATQFIIIEYYPDFWMLTSVYPPLAGVISRDLSYYRKLGVHGMGALVVPCNYGVYQGKNFPWLKYAGFNLYVFGKYCWDADLDAGALLDEYFTSNFGVAGAVLKDYYRRLEHLIAPLSRFNTSLFRLRFNDIWQRDVTPADGGIKFIAEDWNPGQRDSAAEEERRRTVHSLSTELDAIQLEKIPLPNDPVQVRKTEDAREYLGYIKARIASLSCQLSAQQELRGNNREAARQWLQRALEIDGRFYAEDAEHCRKWLG